jgi:hypothetical protein
MSPMKTSDVEWRCIKKVLVNKILINENEFNDLKLHFYFLNHTNHTKLKRWTSTLYYAHQFLSGVVYIYNINIHDRRPDALIIFQEVDKT